MPSSPLVAVAVPFRGRLKPAPEGRPGSREARMQLLVTDALKADPLQFETFRITDGWFEGLHDLSGDRCIGPIPDVEHRGEEYADGSGRDSGLFLSLAERAVDGILALMQGAAGESPGSAMVAPSGAVLQQDALFRIMHEQARGTEASPEAAVLALHPGIAGVARSERPSRLEVRIALRRFLLRLSGWLRGDWAVHPDSLPFLRLACSPGCPCA